MDIDTQHINASSKKRKLLSQNSHVTKTIKKRKIKEVPSFVFLLIYILIRAYNNFFFVFLCSLYCYEYTISLEQFDFWWF